MGEEGIARPLDQGEAYRLLKEHGVVVDPADGRSTIAIATALLLGNITGEGSIEEANPGETVPTANLAHSVPTLRPESSRRMNMF